MNTTRKLIGDDSGGVNTGASSAPLGETPRPAGVPVSAVHVRGKGWYVLDRCITTEKAGVVYDPATPDRRVRTWCWSGTWWEDPIPVNPAGVPAFFKFSFTDPDGRLRKRTWTNEVQKLGYLKQSPPSPGGGCPEMLAAWEQPAAHDPRHEMLWLVTRWETFSTVQEIAAPDGVQRPMLAPMIRQFGQVLQWFHDQPGTEGGVFHGDPNAGNYAIGRRGEFATGELRAWIFDLESAIFETDAAHNGRLMTPEFQQSKFIARVAAGNNMYTRVDDIRGFAAVMFYLATGSAPRDFGGAATSSYNPADRRPKLGVPFGRLVERCLQEEDRTGSAAELAEHLALCVPLPKEQPEATCVRIMGLALQGALPISSGVDAAVWAAKLSASRHPQVHWEAARFYDHIAGTEASPPAAGMYRDLAGRHLYQLADANRIRRDSVTPGSFAPPAYARGLVDRHRERIVAIAAERDADHRNEIRRRVWHAYPPSTSGPKFDDTRPPATGRKRFGTTAWWDAYASRSVPPPDSDEMNGTVLFVPTRSTRVNTHERLHRLLNRSSPSCTMWHIVGGVTVGVSLHRTPPETADLVVTGPERDLNNFFRREGTGANLRAWPHVTKGHRFGSPPTPFLVSDQPLAAAVRLNRPPRPAIRKFTFPDRYLHLPVTVAVAVGLLWALWAIAVVSSQVFGTNPTLRPTADVKFNEETWWTVMLLISGAGALFFWVLYSPFAIRKRRMFTWAGLSVIALSLASFSVLSYSHPRPSEPLAFTPPLSGLPTGYQPEYQTTAAHGHADNGVNATVEYLLGTGGARNPDELARWGPLNVLEDTASPVRIDLGRRTTQLSANSDALTVDVEAMFTNTTAVALPVPAESVRLLVEGDLPDTHNLIRIDSPGRPIWSVPATRDGVNGLFAPVAAPGSVYSIPAGGAVGGDETAVDDHLQFNVPMPKGSPLRILGVAYQDGQQVRGFRSAEKWGSIENPVFMSLSGHPVQWWDVRAGQCENSVDSMHSTVVDCHEKHGYEVTAVFQHPDTNPASPWNEAAMRSWADAQCQEHGNGSDTHLSPAEEAWKNGHRYVVCRKTIT